MNIGTLGQPNVVAIQHQGKIYELYIINIFYEKYIYIFKN